MAQKKYNTVDEKTHFDVKTEDNPNDIQPIRKPRENWGTSFKAMHEAGDDKLLINDVFIEEDLWE